MLRHLHVGIVVTHRWNYQTSLQGYEIELLILLAMIYGTDHLVYGA